MTQTTQRGVAATKSIKKFDPQMTQMAQMKNLGNRKRAQGSHRTRAVADAGTTFANPIPHYLDHWNQSICEARSMNFYETMRQNDG
jgi:hypothetical protein